MIAKLHTSVTSGWTRTNRFQVRFENKGAKAVTGMAGHIRCARARFDQGIRGDLELAAGEAKNGVWEFHVNQFMEETEKMFALGEMDGFDVDIDSLEYADGTKVKRAAD